MNSGSSDGPGLRARCLAARSTARKGLLLEHLRERGAALLGLHGRDAVDPEAPWVSLGFDSLRAVDFSAELARDLGIELRSTLLFDHPNATSLAAFLSHALESSTSPVAAIAPNPGPERAHGCEANAIAIVGAACRFPGADGLDAFWKLLVEGRDAITPIPRSRFDVDAIYHPDPGERGKTYVRQAGLLDGIDLFDAACFGISPREATMLDPQHRLLLETSLHALESANLAPQSLSSRRVGVYVGTHWGGYFDSQTARTPLDATAHYATGNEISTAAGRISYLFGFRGPCYALDTACSGSLVALHVAARALRAGECDAALVGGVNALYDPMAFVGLSRARMLAPDGRSKAFDARADGYGRAEGCGVVVLKRLADAIAEEDCILAVVRGTAINQDGRSSGLTAPHGPAQAEVIRMALADAGVTPDAIDFVEAHGTGTALGDPIEVGALAEVFAGRARPLPIGSVKTNIGHLEPAAGISGLLKAALALRERALPASLHFENGNPHVDWARVPVRVQTSLTRLPSQRECFAGVSSFGFSGTNAHVVLSSPPHPNGNRRAVPQPHRGPLLLCLQAAGIDALRELARLHADALDAADVDLAAWCHAAVTARATASCRAAFVGEGREGFVRMLRAFANGDASAATASSVTGANDAATREQCDESLEHVAARWARGEAVDVAAANGTSGPARVALPLYPFQRRRFWLERKEPEAERVLHPLLGSRIESSVLGKAETLFQSRLSPKSEAWLRDYVEHGGMRLSPGVVAESALAAEAELGASTPIVLRRPVFSAARAVEQRPVVTELLRRILADGSPHSSIRVRDDDGEFRSRFECSRADTPAHRCLRVDFAAAVARCPQEWTASQIAAHCASQRAGLPQSLQWIEGARRGELDAVMSLALPPTLAATASSYVLHPALLDACIQAVRIVLPVAWSYAPPIAAEEIAVCRRGASRCRLHVHLKASGSTSVAADLKLCDDDGEIVATACSLVFEAARGH